MRKKVESLSCKQNYDPDKVTKGEKGKMKNPPTLNWEASAQEKIKQFAGDANEEINIERQKKTFVLTLTVWRFRRKARATGRGCIRELIICVCPLGL